MASIIKETQSIKEAVTHINSVDLNKFSRLLSRIFQRLHLKEERLFSKEEEEKLQSALSLEKQSLNLVVETVSFIIEQAVYHNVKPASLKQQLENLHLHQDKVDAISQAWATAGPETIEKFRQKIFAPRKLEHVGWQLNLQMGQATQAKLKAPSAVLEFGVSSENSECPQKLFVQFSHQELLEFYNKLEVVQAQLDSLT
ncbi:COMM domain-containing protein 10 [Scleropages formosus]|uniref:COMM domain containing 10 n=1 Tax=Scleropages formosus TaxID=113540 RepID=A0A8C9SH34_SCLFO|nr:COMM domain-containing protein 10 [Scleropages formosus]